MEQLRWFIGRYLMGKKSLANKRPVFIHQEDPEEVFDHRGEVLGPYEDGQEMTDMRGI